MTSKNRFFDDPVIKIHNWIIQKEQNWMRDVIAKRYSGILDPQVFWVVGTDKENEGLSADPVERMVQRLALSQIGVFFAHRIWAKRTWVLLPILALIGLFISYLIFNLSGTTEQAWLHPTAIGLTAALAIVLCFAATFFAPLVAQFILPSIPIRQDEIDSVKGIIKRCIVRDLPENTPPDLADRLRVLVADSNGQAVAGQVLSTDLEYSAVRAEWLRSKLVLFFCGLSMLAPVLAVAAGWLAALAYLAYVKAAQVQKAIDQPDDQQEPTPLWDTVKFIGVPVVIGTAFTSGVPSYLSAITPTSIIVLQWAFVLFCWAMTFVYALRIKAPLVMRALLVDQAVRESGSELLIDKAGAAHFQMQEQARIAQIQNAIKDPTPFIQIGTSTGLLAQRRDPFAPTEAGLPVGLSVADLSTHIGVLGASGTGKTTGVIRPVTYAWLRGDMGGLLVLDGKGALPLELQGLHPDYRLISPAHGAFNPIAGMSPDSVADVLADVFGGSEADSFWSDSARLMLRMAAAVLHAHPTQSYTLGNLLRFCVLSDEERLPILDEIISLLDDSKVLLVGAFRYWSKEIPAMPDKTKDSIVNNVRTWLGNIALNEKLGAWTSTTESSIQIESALSGAYLGLLLPESEYGAGGVAISALCMRRLYDAVKKRGDTWRDQEGQTPVLLAADEVQNLLTKSDLETVPVARSLGLYLMLATQNMEGLYKRLTKEGASQLFGNLASIVALPPRAEDSNKYVAERAGKIWRASVNSYNALPDSGSDLGIYLNSGADKNMRDVMLHRQSRIGAPRLSYSIGLWERTWQPKAWGYLEDLAEPDTTDLLNPKPTLNFALSPVVEADELDTLLARPGAALVVLNRGRVQRRDVVILGGVK